jgi:uncharacterized protein (TIGR02145 family)
MQKMFLSCLFFGSLFAISIFAFTCSDRGVSPEIEDQPADNIVKEVTDIDGNVYRTVKIGTQVWMVENLRVSRFRNGDSIPNLIDNKDWAYNTTEAYCNYKNNNDNADIYGLLYNWYAVNDSRKIAPVGWHVPSDAEWQTLIEHLGGSSKAGGDLKNTDGWLHSGNGSNSSEFSALPGGFRASNGLYYGIGYGASFWSSTGIGSDGAWGRWLSYVGSGIGRDDANKMDGFSVRCVKD